MDVLDSDALISIAKDAGFDLGIRASALRRLESWRDAGLLPRQRRVGQQGKRPLWAYPDGADRQLLALLRWRRSTRDLDAIRVALWVEGYSITAANARASLLTMLKKWNQIIDRTVEEQGQRVASESGRAAELDDVVAHLASVAAGKRGGKPAPKTIRMRRDERARGYAYLIRLGLGLGVDDLPVDDAKLAERAIGLAAARRGQQPSRWLDGPPEQLTELAEIFALPALQEAVATATEDELEAARAAAQLLTIGLPLVGIWAESLFGPRAAGLAMLNKLTDAGADWFSVLVPGLINAMRHGMRDNINQIETSLANAKEITRQLDQLAALSPEDRQQALQALPEHQRIQGRHFLTTYDKRRQPPKKRNKKNA